MSLLRRHFWRALVALLAALAPLHAVEAVRLRSTPTNGAAGQDSCSRWNMVWYSFEGWEKDYVPDQLLEKVAKTPPRHLAFEAADIRDCTIAAIRIRGTAPRINETEVASTCSKLSQLLGRYEVQGFRLVFVLLGEEQDSCAACPEFFAAAPLVVRNYYHEDCAQFGDRVMTVPMGLKSPPTQQLLRHKPASQRPFVWSFASNHVNPLRSTMVNQFLAHPATAKSQFRLAYPNSDPLYYETLCNSAFALVPRGNVEDTWRLYESLYCGAIPVVTDGGGYFSKFMPEGVTSRFVTVGADLSPGAFTHAFSDIDVLLGDRKQLDLRQKQLFEAYEQYVGNWHAKVAARIAQVGQFGDI